MDTSTINQIVTIIPTTAIGVMTFIQALRNGKKTDDVAKEVKTNGGYSMKDRSEQNSELMTNFGERLGKQERSLRKLNWVIGRFIIHAGKNDLGHSKLMEYEQKQLDAISPQERAEFVKEAEEEAKRSTTTDEEQF